MKLKTHILAVCALMLGAAGCEKSGSELDAPYYKISVAPNEYCKVEVREQEQAGNKVRAAVTVLDATMKIVSVTWNGTECESVTDENGDTAYEFTMPEKDVVLTVVMEKAQPESHAITVEPNELCKIEAPENARGGEL